MEHQRAVIGARFKGDRAFQVELGFTKLMLVFYEG